MKRRKMPCNGEVPTLHYVNDVQECMGKHPAPILPAPNVVRTLVQIMRLYPSWSGATVCRLAAILTGKAQRFVLSQYGIAMSQRRAEGW